MNHRNAFETWRANIGSVVPTRFGSSVARFRKLQEARKLQEFANSESSDASKVMNSSALDQAVLQAETPEDKAIKKKVEKRQFEAKRAKLQTLKRLRQLSMMDFNMVGGVSPAGSMGGSGGGDGFRPVSMQNRN